MVATTQPPLRLRKIAPGLRRHRRSANSEPSCFFAVLFVVRSGTAPRTHTVNLSVSGPGIRNPPLQWRSPLAYETVTTVSRPGHLMCLPSLLHKNFRPTLPFYPRLPPLKKYLTTDIATTRASHGLSMAQCGSHPRLRRRAIATGTNNDMGSPTRCCSGVHVNVERLRFVNPVTCRHGNVSSASRAAAVSANPACPPRLRPAHRLAAVGTGSRRDDSGFARTAGHRPLLQAQCAGPG